LTLGKIFVMGTYTIPARKLTMRGLRLLARAFSYGKEPASARSMGLENRAGLAGHSA
jgi:hypothetical protein